MAKIKCFSCENIVRDDTSFSCNKQGRIDQAIREGGNCPLYKNEAAEKLAKAKKAVKEEKE